MAKLLRGQLKSIVKECLLEILAEGLASDSADMSASLVEAVRPRRKTKSRRLPEPPTRRVAPDLVSFGSKTAGVVKQLTADPLMSSIFEDTAETTLQNQLQAESRVPSHFQQVAAAGDPAAQVVAGADPMEIFGEASANWAAIAFSDGKKS